MGSNEAGEYDVVVCDAEPRGSNLPETLAAGLARRRFRVFRARERDAGPQANLKVIEETPDFVLLLTPQSLELLRDPASRISEEVKHAVATERNIVPVHGPGFARPPDDPVTPDLADLEKRQPIKYSVRHTEQTIARIAHRLSSDAAVDERQMLRQAKLVGSFAGLVLVVLVAIAAVGVASRMLARKIDVRPLPPMRLAWSTFGQRNDAGRWTEFPVREGSTISGDQLRVAFSPSADGHAYVIGRDIRGNLNVLFPARSVRAESRVVAGRVYQAPADGSWLTVDEASGVERIYVIASYDPIENLESLVDERDEEATVAGAAFFDGTLGGLLDGKHAGIVGRARTRSGRPIADNVEAAAAASSASVTLSNGTRITHTLVTQEGLISALAEIAIRPSTRSR